MTRRVKLQLLLALASAIVATVFLAFAEGNRWLQQVGGFILLFICLAQVSLLARYREDK